MSERRWVVARRYQVFALLLGLSVVFWIGVWTWTEAHMRQMVAAGLPEIAATLEGILVVDMATVGWVVGCSLLHPLILLLAHRRGDLEARAGVLYSAFVHLGFMVAAGVLRW